MILTILQQSYWEWDTNEPTSIVPHRERFAIALVVPPSSNGVTLGRSLAEYLNEFDEDEAGNWAAFDESVTQALSKVEHPMLKRECQCSHGDCPCQVMANEREQRSLVRRIAEAGNAVLLHRGVERLTEGLPQVFQVLLHQDENLKGADIASFHLTLNMARVEDDCAVRIVGDSALDWALRALAA